MKPANHTTPLWLPEWAEQSAVLLSWPQASVWQRQHAAAEQVYCEIIAAVVRQQDVILCHNSPENKARVSGLLAAQGIPAPRLHHYIVNNNDSWTRDYGPLAVQHNDQLQLIDFRFNGWGGKYRYELDDTACRQLAEQQAFAGLPLVHSAFMLEGGSVESDGAGTLLTTSECLLSGTRNPDYSKMDIERTLAETLGINRILWLEHGAIIGDDTDGHVDMLARFCSADTIAYSICHDKNDAHYAELKAMENDLKAFRQADGHPYRLIELPLPAPILNTEGDRLPASYSNFLIMNRQVLLPVYDDPMDAVAIRHLQACFKDRQLIPINCRALIHQYGSLHCATMQLPALPRR